MLMVQNVLNEPRCSYCGPEAVDSWIGDMLAFLKVGSGGCAAGAYGWPGGLGRKYLPMQAVELHGCTGCLLPFCAPPPAASNPCPAAVQSVAPNQLVTTGAEGFFDVSHPMAGARWFLPAMLAH